MSRTWIGTTLLVVGSVLGSPPAVAADDRPAVFLHGFSARGADWAATAERLHHPIAIAPRLPDLSWRQRFSQQAADLQARPEFASLSGTTVVVGHSNGGLVAREWSRTRPVGGIVTLGTPHRGAPLINHFYSWTAFNGAAQGLLNHVLWSFSEWSDWVWIYAYAQTVLGWVSDFSIWSTLNLGLVLGFDSQLPVASDMVPSSSFLANLNSSANLGRESASIPGRVGIVTIARNYFWAGPVRAVAPEWADANAAAIYAAASALLFWGNYILLEAQGADPAALEQGLSLMNVAHHLLTIDPLYCLMVSSADLSQCKPNDGLVPYDSQMYPGAPNLLLGENNDGPAHRQQKEMSDEALYDALVHFVQVPARGAPSSDEPDPSPPGPPPAGSETEAPSPEAPDVVGQGEVLYPFETIDSEDGRFHLRYQGDGNLVLFDEYWSPLWSTSTDGISPGMVVMQHDGNFVMYDADGHPVWASGDSYGHPGACLVVQNDGNVVIYDVDGSPLWATNTAH